MTEVKLEIYDTGMEEKGGSVVYTQASTSWINLQAKTLTPEMDFIGTNNTAKRKNSTGTKFSYVGNRIETMNTPRFTVQCVINDFTTLATIYDMGTTFGLKKIKGGLGTLIAHPGSESGEVYVIIKSFRGNENLSNATNAVSLTITLEVV